MAVYSDLSQINPTKQPLLEDTDAVIQALGTIYSTRPGEHPFRPLFGIDLQDELFNPADDISAVEVFRQAIEAADADPRIIVDQSRTEIIPDSTTGIFALELFWFLRGVQEQPPIFQAVFAR